MPSAQGYQRVPIRRDGASSSNSSSNNSSRVTISDGDLSIARPEDNRLSRMATAGGNLPATYSSQQLMGGDAESVTASLDAGSTVDNCRPNSRSSRQYDGLRSIAYSEWFTVIVLCFVNLINYMDRFTIAGE